MKSAILGSFLGFVLGAALLASCGGDGSSDAPFPPPATSPGAVNWTGLGPRHLIGTGFDLATGETWSSTTIWENAGQARNRYAAFEVAANVTGGTALLEVGILPAIDGTNFATEPQWLGTMEMRALNNRRATLTGVLVPPTRCKMALRLAAGGDVRVLSYAVNPYNESLP